MTTTPVLDEVALEEFLGRAVEDAGAAVSVLLAHLGDRLGLYAAMADLRAVTAADLAADTGVNERMAHEWLCNQTAGGYVTYDPATGRFRLPPEQAFALADEASPALVQGIFDIVVAVYRSVDKELDAFRTGTGLAWGDHHASLFPATERCFRPEYQAHLVQDWIPALTGVHDKLRAGARVADVGCGYGTSTVIMANAFFDCWHDTADPLGVARASKGALAPNGTVVVVEPYANDRLEDNINALGRFGYGTSALACTPCSLSGGGPGLGAQAGETRTRALFTAAGFTSFRRAIETPLSIVYEARA